MDVSITTIQEVTAYVDEKGKLHDSKSGAIVSNLNISAIKLETVLADRKNETFTSTMGSINEITQKMNDYLNMLNTEI